MRLPAGDFHQRLHIDAIRLPQQLQDLVRVATLAGVLSFLAPLNAFLAGVVFLPDLPVVFATSARFCAARAFSLAVGRASAARAALVAVSSAVEIMFLLCLNDFVVRQPFHGFAMEQSRVIRARENGGRVL
jgi:hypothetical protein